MAPTGGGVALELLDAADPFVNLPPTKIIIRIINQVFTDITEFDVVEPLRGRHDRVLLSCNGFDLVVHGHRPKLECNQTYMTEILPILPSFISWNLFEPWLCKFRGQHGQVLASCTGFDLIFHGHRPNLSVIKATLPYFQCENLFERILYLILPDFTGLSQVMDSIRI